MAIKKATTTDDIKGAAEPSAEKGYTRLVAPDGSETIVPDSILDALLESGYKRK